MSVLDGLDHESPKDDPFDQWMASATTRTYSEWMAGERDPGPDPFEDRPPDSGDTLSLGDPLPVVFGNVAYAARSFLFAVIYMLLTPLRWFLRQNPRQPHRGPRDSKPIQPQQEINPRPRGRLGPPKPPPPPAPPVSTGRLARSFPNAAAAAAVVAKVGVTAEEAAIALGMLNGKIGYLLNGGPQDRRIVELTGSRPPKHGYRAKFPRDGVGVEPDRLFHDVYEYRRPGGLYYLYTIEPGRPSPPAGEYQ